MREISNRVLPTEWKEAKLGEYYEIRSGLSKPASDFGKGFPFLSFKDVFNNFFLPEELQELVNTTESERKNMSIKRGDVFLTRTSETNNELGMSSVALKDYPGATFNGFCKRLRPKSNDVDPEFIGFYLRSPKFRAEVSQFSNLTTRASLNNEIINRLHFLLPPLPTQRKIAAVLSAYDDLIENNLRRIQILEEMAQQTYEEWFVRMRFPGHETAVINEKTGLPQGWENFEASKLFDITIGKTPPRSEEIWFNPDEIHNQVKWASITDIRNSRTFIYNSKETISADAADRFNFNFIEEGNVILSFKLTVGLVAIASVRMTTNEAIAHFNNGALPVSYAYYFLKNFDYESLGSTSSIGNAINSKIVKTIPFKVPTDSVVRGFDEIVSPLLQGINKVNQQNQRLREARDLLLPRLMMGIIDVDDLLQEPLSMAAEDEEEYVTGKKRRFT